MGIQDLQAFLESSSLAGGAISVDLLKIARNVTQRQQPHNSNRKIRPIGNKLKLIIDAECCLNRLYGGFFSDWACGGQWNRMVQFLALLMQAIERGNIELAVVFNGTLEICRMEDWVAEQTVVRQKVAMVLKHVTTKATPPPKVWWTAPTCLRTALRMALRHLGTTVMCTMDDHHQEVIAYCREYGSHGLLADDAEYAAFDPPRYFSSQQIKLTYKGSLETKEFMLSELTKTLQLTQDQVCIVASLLGNFLLPESELQDFYKKISNDENNKDNAKLTGDALVKAVAEHVKTLPTTSQMDALVAAVFPSNDKRATLFRQSVLYYLNGTANGFLKYCAPTVNKRENKNNVNKNSSPAKTEDSELDTSGFASETTEQEQESLHNYKLATANVVMSKDIVNITESDGANKTNNDDPSLSSNMNGHTNNSSTSSANKDAKKNSKVIGDNANSSTPSSPKHSDRKLANGQNIVHPTVSADVLRTASLRHQKGLMAPWILHALSAQEIRLPCLLEDENNREFMPIYEIFKLVRQRVYAVLFNLHHLRYLHTKKKESKEIADNVPQPDVIVKEWVYSRFNPYTYPEDVKAEPLPWAVPTLQRLWFGPSLDDKRRRMRALLSCLNSDTPLILNTSYVPQHMLVLACVLRYIMSLEKPILRRNELDVFLCQAFNPDLMNAQYLQELTLNVVTSRGIQLAAMFMQGVEMALLANDACGAPLPWLMCCPWLYFDGKLFHHTLARSAHVKGLLDLCENHIERVVKVERFRKAVLEGLDVKFTKVLIPPYLGMMRPGPPNCMPAMPLPSARGAAGMRQRLPARGGQLQIAGVVVGQWGANYGYHGQNIRPPVIGGGFSGRGRGRGPHHYQYPRTPQPRKPGAPPTFPINKKAPTNKKRGNAKKPAGKGRGFAGKNDNSNELNKQDSSIFDDCKGKERGQGDGPKLEGLSH